MRRFAYHLTGMLLAGSYESEIQTWRTERESRLKTDTGWLTVAGLFWLHEGENYFGSAPANDIVLPSGPARAGWFGLHQDKITVHIKGQQALRALEPDRETAPHLVHIENLTMFPIKRGDRYGIRLRDKNSAFRREFTGLHWFPIQQSARVTAEWVNEPKKMGIPNILGQTEDEKSPGYARFHWAGHELRLRPIEEDGQLFFIFRDL